MFRGGLSMRNSTRSGSLGISERTMTMRSLVGSHPETPPLAREEEQFVNFPDGHQSLRVTTEFYLRAVSRAGLAFGRSRKLVTSVLT